MSEPGPFADFIARIRAGDQSAAEELVRSYEPLVRREIRVKMTDRRMARVFDSMDVCQSIWSSFFVRAAAGQYDLDSPQHLARLLVAMAKNKLVSQARRHHYRKRDLGRIADTGSALDKVSDNSPSPSECASAKELFLQLQQNLTKDERQVAELRRNGLSWEAVASELGGTAQARRMQLVRAADRVIDQLGLDD
jgi:RNA polymerase sigma-70 factor (ECF subfamily)